MLKRLSNGKNKIEFLKDFFQIKGAECRLNEVQKLLAGNEEKLEQLKESLALQQQKAEQERLKFEKESSAAQALIKAGADREAALQNQIETLRQALHEAELKTAVAEALYQKNQKDTYRKPKA